MSKSFKTREQIWAVIRYDTDRADPEVAFTVKEIVRDRELAEAEVSRLNELNRKNKCRYWCEMTRLFPHDSSAGSKNSQSQ